MLQTRCLCCGLFLLLLITCLPGCNQNQERLQALERELQGLQADLEAVQGRLQELETRHRKDIREVKTDLSHLLEYLNASFQHLGRTGPEAEPSLEESARKTLRKSLDQLMDMARELLDKLEMDLQEPKP